MDNQDKDNDQDDEEETPSHRCLIVDRSFEALKSARSSTVAMYHFSKQMADQLHSEVQKGHEYARDVSEGKTFLHQAENDSVLTVIREREQNEVQDGSIGSDIEENSSTTKQESSNGEETAKDLSSQTSSKAQEKDAKNGRVTEESSSNESTDIPT